MKMKIKDLLKKLETLPKEVEFSLFGVDNWHPEVFDREVQTLEDAIDFIKQLKERVNEQSEVLTQLVHSYNDIILWIKDLEITE